MKNTTVDNAAVSPFKRAHLRHRRRADDPHRSDDLSELLDFSLGSDDRITQIELPKEANLIPNLYRGSLYGLKDVPGFLFAPQALTEDLQLELAYEAVTRYCERPHKTNIDLCPPKLSEIENDEEFMWGIWKKSGERREATKLAKKQKVELTSKQKYRSFHKLSWATMGYHYDWTARSYNESHKSEMPQLVEDLSCRFARTALTVESKRSPKETKSLSFAATASIVNYYNIKSTMGGHRDDLELALDKPIISLSTGLPAIFLLGGATKEDEPVFAMIIRPGDVLILGGASRLNFHGMARLLPASSILPSCTDDNAVSLEVLSNTKRGFPEYEREALKEYLSDHRININVRQVYPDGKGS